MGVKLHMNYDTTQTDSKINGSLVLLMATACGIIVANLYYAQPLLSQIARTFNVSEKNIGMVPMLNQIGYAIGMFFILPLGDIKEKRWLITLMLCLSAISLTLMSISQNINMLFFSAFAVGLTNVVPHLIVAFAAQLSKPSERGKTIGTVMSGLLIGILLSRTFSGIVGSAFGWRLVYAIAVVLILLLAVVLWILFPVTPAKSTIGYTKLLKSLWDLFKNEPILRQASLSGAMMFAAFSAFWTTLIFLLESPIYKLGAQTAGLFGLVGVVGALAVPLVGRFADKKNPKFTLFLAAFCSALSFICFWIIGLKLWGLIIGVILLDLGTQSGQISNQTRIYALNGEARNRINTIFMVSYFIGGSLGSYLGAYGWSRFGWSGVCAVGLCFLLVEIISQVIRKK
jgi:predicted MFS family arabinose efflux permease